MPQRADAAVSIDQPQNFIEMRAHERDQRLADGRCHEPLLDFLHAHRRKRHSQLDGALRVNFAVAPFIVRHRGRWWWRTARLGGAHRPGRAKVRADFFESQRSVALKHQRDDARDVRRGHAGAVHRHVKSHAAIAAKPDAACSGFCRDHAHARRHDIGAQTVGIARGVWRKCVWRGRRCEGRSCAGKIGERSGTRIVCADSDHVSRGARSAQRPRIVAVDIAKTGKFVCLRRTDPAVEIDIGAGGFPQCDRPCAAGYWRRGATGYGRCSRNRKGDLVFVVVRVIQRRIYEHRVVRNSLRR